MAEDRHEDLREGVENFFRRLAEFTDLEEARVWMRQTLNDYERTNPTLCKAVWLEFVGHYVRSVQRKR